MSHTVQIDYQQIAVQCHSICEVAESQIKELDKMLNELEASASTLLNEQTALLRNQIEKEKLTLLNEIKNILNKADIDAKKGIVAVDSYRVSNTTTVKLANDLGAKVNTLASSKLVEMRALIDSILSQNINDMQQRFREQASGTVGLSHSTESILNSITDDILKQFTYIAYLNNPTLTGEALLSAGKSLMSESIEARYEKETERIKSELLASKIPTDTAEKIVSGGKSLSEIRELATTEIVGEKVRQKSIKIIVSAIKERGFIVDKKNIRIDRQSNEVTIVALKASGEKATFKVFLDGKFIYDFRGYEGQACQKDIEPFMQALEEVYGMHIVSKQEIWSNPDKISTMKYQVMNSNKNKG